MALADTAKLVVDLSLKGNFAAQLAASEKSLTGFNKQITSTGTRAYKAGQQIGTGIKTGAVLAAGAIGFLATQVGFGLRALSELETITTQTNAVLKSTKGVAGQTADSVRKLADQYESLNATIDDKVIQSGENLLLTFTNIRQKAFEPALKAALDMNTALGRGESGLQGTIQQLGVALNDPIRGLTRLQRAGITFTKSQKDQIETAVKAGDTFKAQGIILAELNKRFGGSFLAGGQTTTGKIAKFKDAIEELQKSLATALLPTIGKVADRLSTFLQDPKVIKTVSDLGQSIAGLFSDKNLAEGGRILSSFFDTAKAAAPVLKDAGLAMLNIVKTAVGVFTSLPKEVQQLAVGAFAINKITGGLVTNLAGGLIDLIGKSRGATPANPVFVADVAGGLGGAAGGAGLLSKLGGVLTKLGGLALVLGGVAALGAGTQAGGPGGAGIGALGAGATIAGGALIAGPLGAIVASLGVVGKTLLDIRDASKHQGDDIASSINAQITGGAKLSDLRTSLAAVNTGINEIQANPLNVLVAGDALDQLRAQRDLLQKQIAETQRNTTATVNAATGFTTGLTKFLPGKQKDDIVNLVQLQKSALAFLRDQFREMVASIRKASSPAQIAAAIKGIEKNVFERSKGGVGGAKTVIDALKGLLLRTDDPKSRAAISGEIRRMEHQLNYRTIVAAQLRKANQILGSSESTKRKIAELTAIQRSFNPKDLAAQHAVQAKIDQLKRAELYAAHATTQAIKDKDLSVKVNTTVNTATYVSAREVSRTSRTISKYFATAS